MKHFFLSSFMVATNLSAAPNCPSTKAPDADRLLTAEQAAAVALPALKKKYGIADISAAMPFHATLVGDIWHIQVTLPKSAIGGTAEAHVCRTNGKILDIYHAQ